MPTRILLRNSTDRQAKAATIDAQRPGCQAIAARLPGPVVEYAEEGVSGAAPLEERPDMRRLLRDLQAGDVVVAFALDRLSRADDLIEQAAIYGAIQRAGARIETVMDGATDLTSMVGRVMLSFRTEAAAEERRKIASRTAAGRANVLTIGGKPSGATPFGLTYDRERRRWGIDELAAEVVRAIYARTIAGEPSRAIARDLGWHAARVWRVVTSTTYRGEKPGHKASGRTIPVPAIVDPETWHAAQAALLAAGKRGLRRTQHVYLLDEGLGRCGLCGGALRVYWGGYTRGRHGRTRYYACERARAGNCGLKWWRCEEADGRVWEGIVDLLSDRERVRQVLDVRAEDGGAGKEQAAGFAAQLEALDGREQVILQQFGRGKVSAAGFATSTDALARQRAVLERSRDAALEDAARARQGRADMAEVLAGLEALARGAELADTAERRRMLRSLRPVVEVDAEEIRVRVELVRQAPAVVLALCAPWRGEREGDVRMRRR